MAQEPIELTRLNKGITLRGAFGSAFRNLVCHDLRLLCKDCELHSNCPYGFIFTPTVPPEAKKLRLNQDIPRPFVIKPPLEKQSNYAPGDRFHFELAVVGRAQEFLPYFIVTFEELGRRGIGIKRGQYSLTQLEAYKGQGSWEEIFHQRDRMVRQPGEPLSFGRFSLETDSSVHRIRLRFLTPILLKEKGSWRKPRFAPLMKRLRDRVNALSYFYCGEALEMDFREFGEAAERIVTKEEDLSWVEERRHSKHRNLRHLLKGYLGEVVFEGDLAPFMPLLRIGEFLHVGKATAFGQGWYEMEVLR